MPDLEGARFEARRRNLDLVDTGDLELPASPNSANGVTDGVPGSDKLRLDASVVDVAHPSGDPRGATELLYIRSKAHPLDDAAEAEVDGVSVG
jgi:hypothetical protein